MSEFPTGYDPILSPLLNRGKVMGLKSRDAPAKRFNRLMWWLEQHAREAVGPGLHARKHYIESRLGELLPLAGWSPLECDLLARSLPGAWRKFETFGCFTEAGARMRNGYSGVIQRGKFAGEKVEIDHIVAYSHSVAARNFPGNYDPLPRSANRAKQARVRERDLAIARMLQRIGIIGADVLEQLARAARDKTHRPLNNRSASTAVARAVRSLGVSAGISTGSGGLDPQQMISAVMEFTYQLEDTLHRWTTAIVDSVHAQRQSTEAATQVRGWSASIQYQAVVDEEEAARAREDERHREARLAELSHQINTTSAASRDANETARSKLKTWKSEESDAEQWVAHATYRVNQAQSEVARSQQALEQAKYQLRSAESELAAARGRMEFAGKDSKGNPMYRPADTSRQEAAVRQARAAVDHCQRQLNEALDELRSAKRELSGANDRLSACRQAVAVAGQAVEAATRAGELVRGCEALQERAGEELSRLGRLVTNASQLAIRETETAEHMIARSRAADSTHESAAFQANAAREQDDDARRLTTAGTLEIRERLDSVRMFDRGWT